MPLHLIISADPELVEAVRAANPRQLQDPQDCPSWKWLVVYAVGQF